MCLLFCSLSVYLYTQILITEFDYLLDFIIFDILFCKIRECKWCHIFCIKHTVCTANSAQISYWNIGLCGKRFLIVIVKACTLAE